MLYLAAISENSKVEGGGKGDESADKFFDPLQAACKTKYPKLIEIALEAIHYLLGEALQYRLKFPCLFILGVLVLCFDNSYFPFDCVFFLAHIYTCYFTHLALNACCRTWVFAWV